MDNRRLSRTSCNADDTVSFGRPDLDSRRKYMLIVCPCKLVNSHMVETNNEAPLSGGISYVIIKLHTHIAGMGFRFRRRVNSISNKH